MNSHADPPPVGATNQPWPHAPPHWTQSAGTYLVTAGTFQKMKLCNTPQKLDLIRDTLLSTANEFRWKPHAWAVLSNHYHVLADSPASNGEALREWLRELHRRTAISINVLDETPGRRVWHNFWESLISHQRSYLARLRYVNENPVHHRLVASSLQYAWCSAAWFETNAPKPFVASVARFKIDKLNVYDDFT